MQASGIITLTTDFGVRDHYAALLKGHILSEGQAVQFIDISHQVQAYNIGQAAYLLGASFWAFPKGSIHIVSVHNFYQEHPRFLVIAHKGHYFIGPDNGVFSLLFKEKPQEIYQLISEEPPSLLSMQRLFAKASAHLLAQQPLEEIGRKSDELLERISLNAVVSKDYIRAAVLYIDVYENVVLNVDRSLFEEIAQGRSFELYFKRFDPISDLSLHYAEQAVGEVLCLFNSSGLLEIAVNAGKAASLFGLKVDDSVQLEFLND